MVDLIYNLLTCCQFLDNKEIKKLTVKVMLAMISASVMATLATATPKHKAFLDFKANLTEAFWPSTFSATSSLPPKTEGNLPALFKPGPSKRGIKRIKVEEAKKAS